MSYMQDTAVFISSGAFWSHGVLQIRRQGTFEPEGTDNGGRGAGILSEVFYVGIFILISIRCSWILERYIPATSREI